RYTVLPQQLPLFVRIPGSDWADGGWSADDAVALAAVLKARGVDVMDVTSGGLVTHQKIAVGPAYQTPFAAKVNRETGALTSDRRYTVLPQQLPLFVRIPGSDWADGGWSADDAVALAAVLKARGVDVMDVTSGGLVTHQKIAVGPAYQTPFAAKVKRETGALT